MAGYISALAAAAILCGIANAITGEEGAAGKAIKLMSSVILLLCILKPVLRLNMGQYSGFLDGITADAQSAVSNGENVAQDALRDIIISRTEAYILDKATLYGAQLSVTLTLTEDALPVPASVTLRGNYSPYARQRLSEVLQEDLGIGQEDQLWIGQS